MYGITGTHCVFGPTEDGAAWTGLPGRRHISISSRGGHAEHITESRCVPQRQPRIHDIRKLHDDGHEEVRHPEATRKSIRERSLVDVDRPPDERESRARREPERPIER